MFIGFLHDRALSWYMNFIENGPKTKQEIKKNFLEFFQMQDNKHLEAQKMKAIAQRVGKSVCEYDKRFKYLLNQMPAKMEESILNE